MCEWYQRILGYSSSDGANPYQILGLPQTATEKQIKKAFRELSRKYHPDKTGNDPVKKEIFMKIQGAMVGRCKLNSVEACVERDSFQRLKLKCGELLSIFAFNFNLRRYTKEVITKVGRCRLTVTKPVLKAPMVSALDTKI